MCRGKVCRLSQWIWILKQDNPENFGSEKILELVWLFTWSVLPRGPLPSLQFLGVGCFQRRPQASEKLQMGETENLIGLNLTGCGLPGPNQQPWTRLVLRIRNSFFSSAQESLLGQFHEFFGTTNDFYLELNQNMFIKSVLYITGTCTCLFSLS